jgi:hypothetical protein
MQWTKDRASGLFLSTASQSAVIGTPPVTQAQFYVALEPLIKGWHYVVERAILYASASGAINSNSCGIHIAPPGYLGQVFQFISNVTPPANAQVIMAALQGTVRVDDPTNFVGTLWTSSTVQEYIAQNFIIPGTHTLFGFFSSFSGVPSNFTLSLAMLASVEKDC